jgi:hypothetical protein
LSNFIKSEVAMLGLIVLVLIIVVLVLLIKRL